jgi:hypothetical protein
MTAQEVFEWFVWAGATMLDPHVRDSFTLA